ncbi:hypothetical protein, partial [Paenibacillus sp. EPM92]|uniref:hypothetical protein n=1 Tax=Paenibacillus sp. EPM92 TaxID=1561195 RepID=UPI001F41D94C
QTKNLQNQVTLVLEVTLSSDIAAYKPGSNGGSRGAVHANQAQSSDFGAAGPAGISPSCRHGSASTFSFWVPTT